MPNWMQSTVCLVLTCGSFIVEAIKKHMIDEEVRLQLRVLAELDSYTLQGIAEVPSQMGRMGR